MATLERRIEALEAGDGFDGVRLIMTATAQSAAGPMRLTATLGEAQHMQHHDESEAQFRTRVATALHRSVPKGKAVSIVWVDAVDANL